MTRTSNKQAKKRPSIEVKAGDWVLIGGSSASLPGDWFTASVLWADNTHVLLHRGSLNGTEFWRQVEPVECIRAVGTIPELNAIQKQARETVAEYQRAVRDAEQALVASRKVVWAEVEKLAAGGLAVIPRDEEATTEREAFERRAVEAVEAELQPASA